MITRSGAAGDVRIASWSGVLPTRTQLVDWQDGILNRPPVDGQQVIFRGAGRSFGDASYITGGVTLASRSLTQISDLDPESRTIVCEPGVQMIDLYAYLEASDLSLPVAGGTRWVTVGGAVASDIHGKNDERHGSFANHVVSLDLITADGRAVSCSKSTKPQLFAATLGGMGLTGFIRRATLRLDRAPSNMVRLRTSPLGSIEDVRERFETSGDEFRVAWMDMTRKRPRGIYYGAVYAEGPGKPPTRPITIRLPAIKLFSRPLVKLLNAARYSTKRRVDVITHVLNVHYPVDSLKHWNRFYGRRGSHEYQFVVPTRHLETAYREFLEGCARCSIYPFFVVIKKFGSVPREGLLSFPKPGYTITANFEHRPSNLRFFRSFNDRVVELDGRTYLAKDSYTLPDQLEKMYVGLQEWRAIVQDADPENRIQSDLSRRLGLKPW